jgi:surface protein
MFERLYNLTTINGLEYLNTSHVTDMSYMFNLCYGLETLDLTGFNTENVSDMSYMFSNCSGLYHIYCNDNWDRPNIQSEKMFYLCNSLPNYDSDHNEVSSAKPTSEGGYFTKREAYAIVADGNLTFFYDANKPASGSLEFTNTGEGSWRSATFTSVTFDASMKNYKFISTEGMFSGLTNLTVINDLTYLNTSTITDMSNMFNGCSSLATIYCNNDWSSLSIPSDNMFLDCTKLDGYNSSNVWIAFAKPTEGGYFTIHSLPYAVLSDETLTFYYDTYKETRQGTVYDIPWEGNFPGWNEPEGEVDPYLAPARKANAYYVNPYISYAVFDESFSYYHGLTSTRGMFAGLRKLETISDIEYLNTENVTDMSHMFEDCHQLKSIDLSNFDTRNVTNMSYMFIGLGNMIEVISLDFSNFETEQVTDMSYMFKYASGLKSLDLSNFDTGNVTNMSHMFESCYYLENLNLSGFNTERVTDMSGMFRGCSSLTNLDLADFNTARVSNMEELFDNCNKLTSLDLSNFNTSMVSNMQSMFSDCKKLTSLDLSNFNTSMVSNMSHMFQSCQQLQSLNLSSFDTRNVTDIEYMFSGCSELTSLDLTSFTVSSDNYLTLSNMFSYCSKLESIFCNSDFNNGHVDYYNGNNLFSGSSKLKGAIDFNSSKTNYTFANPTTGYFTYGLRDNAENSSLIDDTESMPRVGLVGRTLYKDGDWNTLCLPFSVEDSNPNDGLTFSGTPLEGATVMTLDNSADSQTGFDPSSGTLTLNFVDVNSIEAGKPYIIKWNSGENIVNPTFTGVIISSTPSPVVAPSVTFIGTYNPQPLTSANSDILYLGAGNTLYYPSSDMTINAFRSYFELNLPSSQQVKSFVLNFGDEEAASIKTISESSDHSKCSDTYFTLDGRRMLEKPTQKGMYIHNNRKVLIK